MKQTRQFTKHVVYGKVPKVKCIRVPLQEAADLPAHNNYASLFECTMNTHGHRLHGKKRAHSGGSAD